MNIYTFPYIWHRSLHLVSHPGLQSTPWDAHRKGSMSAPSFRKNYDMRNKLWPIMFQNLTFPSRTREPPPEEMIHIYIYICLLYIHTSGNICRNLVPSGIIWRHAGDTRGAASSAQEHPGAPKIHPGGTQESPRMHPGTPRRHPRAPRRHPGGTQ